MGMEEYAIVLDYLPQGRHHGDDKPVYKREPVAYAIGEEFLTLIELVPRRGVALSPHERVYIGKDERDKIEYIKKRAEYDELTSAAKSELPYAVDEIVTKNEAKFIEFFNESQAVSTRLHRLELLPGIGKKLMWEIINGRKNKFTSFKDISERIKSLPDPKKLIIKRILLELEGGERRLGKGKYKLFVAPPPARGNR
jgi:putative nucleotide binding protein